MGNTGGQVLFFQAGKAKVGRKGKMESYWPFILLNIPLLG